MADVTQKMIYDSLVRLDERLNSLVEQVTEFAALVRETNRELAEGQRRNDIAREKLNSRMSSRNRSGL